MGKNITREELLEEVFLALVDPIPPIGENEIPLVDIAKAQRTKTECIERKLRDNMPAGCEIVERRGYNSRRMKCIRKIPTE